MFSLSISDKVEAYNLVAYKKNDVCICKMLLLRTLVGFAVVVCVVDLAAAFYGATLLVCVALAGADELCCWV